MLSIDQNSHSLWDALPKLAALTRAGRAVSHYVEDVDVAFTAVGAEDASQPLRLERERYHHSGGADWGAALFYTCFLGRLPVELRDWEPLAGMKPAALARQLGTDVKGLYGRYSPGDNWQLIGPSYAGDDLHRTIADLRLDEVGSFLDRLMDIARDDMLTRFPQADPRQRVREWFDREWARVDELTRRCDGWLVDLYRLWLGEYLGSAVPVGLASGLLAPQPGGAAGRLLGMFLRDYDRLTDLYNQAAASVNLCLRPLRTGRGELPFFAAMHRDGRYVRTGVWREGRGIRIGERTFPADSAGQVDMAALVAAGVTSLAGKAILLVTQVRMGPQGQPLALPYRGSWYMPAAHEFVRLLRTEGLLDEPLQPVVRVRLGLLEHLRELDTIIRLPSHLAAAMGREEVAARELGEAARDLQSAAAGRLESFRTAEGRQAWQRQAQPELLQRITELDARRRQLARSDPKGPRIRHISQEVKALQVRLLGAFVEQLDRDWQLSQLDYYDSRGALLPWCVALGGMEFYDHVIASARIYEETEG